MKNNYGNYVVQKALKLASEANRKRIIDLVMKNIDRIGEKKLILKWKLIVQSYVCNEVRVDHQGRSYNSQFVNFDDCVNKAYTNDYYYVQKI